MEQKKVSAEMAKLALEALEDKKAEQNELLEKAMYDQQTSEQAYEELMAASEQVARMIRQRDRGSSGGYYSGEGMIWPLDGPVTSEFGWRVHPIFGTSRYHSGLDIGGDYGLPIRAAAGGTVIYSGWISGYGYAVIIDHGGGLTTLYGHNEELTVGEGESVSQGDIIAWCGSTGNSTGPHCHFEVRLDGEVVLLSGVFSSGLKACNLEIVARLILLFILFGDRPVVLVADLDSVAG